MDRSDNSLVPNIHHTGMDLNSESDFVVGITPQYWTYTRISVIDVVNLKLKHGINWLHPPLSSSELSTPLSKCLLIGHIVYAAERRGGSMVYVLDDGTGLIDCVHWSSSNSNTIHDSYHLPSLTDHLDEEENHGGFSVGQQVRVFGKIECLASTSKKTIKCQETKARGNDHSSENKSVVREIQIRFIERVEEYLVSEAQYWINSSRLNRVNLRSCLDALGPQIRSHIQNRVNLPAAHDKLCSWRVFGINCTCKLPYTEDLLYCHCQCTAEHLDPFYRFRDALLNKLLTMQSVTTKRLQFRYKEVRNDNYLQEVALKEIITNQTIDKNELINKLFRKTFRALRLDGILYLLDDNTDYYVLITRKKVLEPFIKDQTEKEMETSKTAQNFVSYERAPKFISKVHNERLLYVKRHLVGRKNLINLKFKIP